jgi:hypothetical protein
VCQYGRFNIRYRRRPNDEPNLNSSLNDDWALLEPTEPTETQIQNSMTQITSSSATTSSQVENEPEFVTASKKPYTGKKRGPKPKVLTTEISSANEHPVLRKSTRNKNGEILGRPGQVGPALTFDN